MACPDHILYDQSDPDAPSSIKDGNGDIVLGLCKVCGRGEVELEEPCVPKTGLASRISTVPKLHDNETPLWMGPCAEGPLGGITQSMLVRFLSCRERFRLKYVLGLEPHDRWNHRLGYGNMWHVCEEAFSSDNDDGTGASVKLMLYVNEQITKYPLQRDEIIKWYSVCRVQFPEYVKYWAEHPDVLGREPLLQEAKFDVPYELPSGRVVRLRGKWDSVDLIEAYTDERGNHTPRGIWLQENKTKGDVDKMQIERQLKFDLQTMLYLIALKEWQHDHCEDAPDSDPAYNPILGVRYNVVRRPLSGGKGSIRPHAAKFAGGKLKIPEETPEQFYERLRKDYIEAEPDYWFFRPRAEVSERDYEVFRDECLDPLLEQVCWWYDQITDPDGVKERVVKYGCGMSIPPMNYRTPFGVYSALEEGGATEYDAFLATGSEAGLRRVNELFPELK